LFDPVINSAGQTAFVSGGYGIWSEGGGSLHLVAQRGDQPPGTAAGTQFYYFENLALNNAGRTAFAAELLSGTGGVTSSNDTGVWSEGGGLLALIAREGSHAPGTPAGANFGEFCWYCGDTFAYNGTGQTAFRAQLLTGSGGVDSTNNVGIWAVDRAGALQLVARTGDQLDVDPGPGVNLRAVLDLKFWGGPGTEGGLSNGLSDNGQLAFIATFTDYSYGVFVSNAVASPAVTGDINGDGKVDAADYVVWRKNPGGIYTQNDRTTWRANFGQTVSGAGTVVNTAVPEPASIAMFIAGALATCFVGSARQCRKLIRA
jgi:hypothetical protein